MLTCLSMRGCYEGDKEGYGDIMDKSILAVNKDSLERVLVKNPMIKSAQVYYSLDGYIHVNILNEGYYV